MPPDDLRIFKTLRRHHVPFVIVGGHAVNYYGFARMTEDCDVVWKRTVETERALMAALDELGAQYVEAEIDPATGIEKLHRITPAHVKANHLLMLVVGNGFLDLFDHIPGHRTEDVEELFKTSFDYEGYLFPSLEWLKRMKKARGNVRDLIDLENLQLPPDQPKRD